MSPRKDREVRNYRIVGLSPSNTVLIDVGGHRRDTGTPPSHWGTWGLSRGEIAILRRGLTRGGKDRAVPKGA